jgi:hypothetical protein
LREKARGFLKKKCKGRGGYRIGYFGTGWQHKKALEMMPNP